MCSIRFGVFLQIHWFFVRRHQKSASKASAMLLLISVQLPRQFHVMHSSRIHTKAYFSNGQQRLRPLYQTQKSDSAYQQWFDLIWYLAELLHWEQTSWTQRLFVRAYTKTNITTLLTWIYQHSWIKQSTNQFQLMCCCCCCAKPCWVPFLFSVSNLPSIKHVLPEVLPLAICICNIHVCCIRFKTLHQKLGSCKLCLHQSCLSKLSWVGYFLFFF